MIRTPPSLLRAWVQYLLGETKILQAMQHVKEKKKQKDLGSKYVGLLLFGC